VKRYIIRHNPENSVDTPYYHKFNMKRLSDRIIDELIGICKGCIVDQELTDEEIRFLERWISENSEFKELYPVNVFYQRIREILLDGVVDDEERKQLFSLLVEFTGVGQDNKRVKASSSLPLDHPLPEIIIPGNSFCFTGVFAFGTRERCETETTLRQGLLSKNVSQGTDYLVIGAMSSVDWIHSSYGRKIEKAMELKQKKKKPWIVSEEHWTERAGTINSDNDLSGKAAL
jgi:NAD-dependent DNA ligase